MLKPDRLFPLDLKEAEMLARITRKERAYSLFRLSEEELRLGQNITNDQFWRKSE